MIPKKFDVLYNMLERLALRHSFSDVFEAFLIILVNYFSDGAYSTKRDLIIKRFSDDDRTILNKSFIEFFNSFNAFFNSSNIVWFDILGAIYENFSSRHKAKGLGQYFTPAPICDMMVKFIISDTEKEGQILEPASGSGRMILAAHAVAPYYHFVAIDTDYICYLMTVVNMFMHGAFGVVYWANSLSNEPAREALQISVHPIFKIPFVSFADPTKKPIYSGGTLTKPDLEAPEPVNISKDDGKGYIQLSLF